MGTLSVFYRPAQPEASREVTVPGTSRARRLGAGALDVHAPERHAVQAVPARAFGRREARCATSRTSSSRLRSRRSTVTSRSARSTTPRSSTLAASSRTQTGTTGNQGHRAGRRLDRPRHRLLDLERLHAAADRADERRPERQRHHDGVRPRHRRFRPEPGRGALPRAPASASGTSSSSTMRAAISGARRSPSANPIQLDSEAEDLNGNVAYSFNKAVNFQSVPARRRSRAGDPDRQSAARRRTSRSTSRCAPASRAPRRRRSRAARARPTAARRSRAAACSTPRRRGCTPSLSRPRISRATRPRRASRTPSAFAFGGFQQPVDNLPTLNTATREARSRSSGRSSTLPETPM